MSWVFVAIFSPILSALGSYTDKYILVHHEHTGGAGVVLIFSSVFGAMVMVIALLFGADIWSISWFEAFILALNGCITVGTLAAYLYAIKDSDVVSVVPTLQTVPVFGFILGYFALGETLTFHEIIGSIIVILSAILLSLEIEEGVRLRFRARSFFLALLSALLFAISGVVFKLFALDYGYWTVQFWEYVGITAVGLVLFASVASYRNNFLTVVHHGRVDVAALNFMTEAIMVSADLILNYATLLAPIALVYTMSSFQPAFLLIFALIGSALMPALMQKMAFLRKHIPLKALAIAIMIVGAAVIHLG